MMLLVSAVLIGLMIMIACGGEEKEAKVDAKSMTEDVKEAAGDMKETATEQLLAKKDEFVADMKSKLETWDGKLADLKTKTDALNPTAKKLVEKPMAELMEKKDIAYAKLDALKAASAGDFTKASEELTGSVKDVGTAYDKVVSLLK